MTDNGEVRSATLRSIEELQARLEPEIQCKLGGMQSSCLADTGAGANYMSLKYAQHRGFAIDRDRTGRVRLANGHETKTLAAVGLPLSFKNEKNAFQVQFHILLKYSRNVNIGSPFLRMTETLSRFVHRITSRLCSRSSHRVRYMGGGEQLMEGQLNGTTVEALPDTGSDIMLLSEKFALQQGFHIDSSDQQRISLEFGDESFGRAVGVVRDLKWTYSDGPTGSFTADFYVLPGPDCDVLLSFDFLVRTGAMQLPFFANVEEIFDEHYAQCYQSAPGKFQHPEPEAFDQRT